MQKYLRLIKIVRFLHKQGLVIISNYINILDEHIDYKNGTYCHSVQYQTTRVKVGVMPWPEKGAAHTLYSGSL